MRTFNERVSILATVLVMATLLGCSAANEASEPEGLSSTESELTAQDRLATCSQDPRVTEVDPIVWTRSEGV